MTKFHSDDYVHFLSSLTPENVDSFTNNPCKSPLSLSTGYDEVMYNEVHSVYPYLSKLEYVASRGSVSAKCQRLAIMTILFVYNQLPRYIDPSLQISLDMITHHTKAPSNSVQSPLVVQYRAHTD